MKVAASAVVAGTVLGRAAQRARAQQAQIDPTHARIDRVVGQFGQQQAFSGDGGNALSAGLGHVPAIAVAQSGDMYIAEIVDSAKPQSVASIVRRITAQSQVITRVAGTGSSGYEFRPPGQWVRIGDPTASRPLAAYLGAVMGLAVEQSGNLLIASSDPAGYGVIRRLGARTGRLDIVAGSQGGRLDEGVPAVGALLPGPIGLAVETPSRTIVAEFGHHRVRRIDSASGLIATIAGTGRTFRSRYQVSDPMKGQVFRFSVTDVGDGGQAADAVVFNPWGVAFDSAGRLLVTEYGGHRLRRIDPDGIITTLAGTGLPGFSGDGGPAHLAQFNHPKGVAVDAAGNIYVADSDNSRVRLINTAGTVSTIAGTGVAGYSGDGGDARNAQLAAPSALAFAPSGVLLIADDGNRLIRQVSS